MSAAASSLDVAPIAAFLDGRLERLDLASIQIEPMGGGTSNPTFLLHTNVGKLVLRHAPPGHGLRGAHDMAREYRVIAALGPTDVPVPGAIGLAEDESLLGAPFYVMTHVDGVIIADRPPLQPMPPGYASTLEERRRIGMGMIDSLVRLHAVNPAAVGLAEFGRPEGYVERQVQRWTEQWNTWRTRNFPEMNELLRRLARAVPRSRDYTIVHGDYRLGNLILSRTDPGRVEAVLDWEMATLGDPIADVGYTLIYWGEPGDPPDRVSSMDLALLTVQPGFMTREELVAEYAARTGRDVSSVDFFEMLGRVKLAVFGERGYARSLQAGSVVAERNPADSPTDAHVRQALAVGDQSANPLLRA